MSVMPPTTRNNRMEKKEILARCRIITGTIVASEDYRYFALLCSTCEDKYLKLNKYIRHVREKHIYPLPETDKLCSRTNNIHRNNHATRQHQLKETSTGKNTPSSKLNVCIKQESNLDEGTSMFEAEPVKVSQRDIVLNFYSNSHIPLIDLLDDDDSLIDETVDDFQPNPSIPQSTPIALNDLNNRKLVQFLIKSFSLHPFLWDETHPFYREQTQEKHFINWLELELQKRFHVKLNKDTIQEKWNSLLLAYNRETERVQKEKGYVSDLWFFKDMQFLSKKDFNPQDSSFWCKPMMNLLIALLKENPCFYAYKHDSSHLKEKRTNSLEHIATKLSEIKKISAQQVSKRISQLKREYSKQKHERLLCEGAAQPFNPTYPYYEQLLFLDKDVPPFRCRYCPAILVSHTKMDTHYQTHRAAAVNDWQSSTALPSMSPIKQTSSLPSIKPSNVTAAALASPPPISNSNGNKANTNFKRDYQCEFCNTTCKNKALFERHLKTHSSTLKRKTHKKPDVTTESHYSNVDNHSAASQKGNETVPLILLDQQNHDVEMVNVQGEGTNSETEAKQSTKNKSLVNKNRFECSFEKCTRIFASKRTLSEHYKRHFEKHICDICSKTFQLARNLQYHKQIHEPFKKYICSCGAAFAQSAGLYMHKKRRGHKNMPKSPTILESNA